MKNFNFCAILTVFVGRTPSQIFDMALNTPLINIEHKMNSVADKTQFLCIFFTLIYEDDSSYLGVIHLLRTQNVSKN